jgi:surface protein
MGVNSTNKGFIGSTETENYIGIKNSRNDFLNLKEYYQEPSPYTRPSEWISLPSITAGEQRFAGVYAIYDTDSNFAAFTIEGNYTVDWGDGTTGSFSSGVPAYKRYNRTTYAGLTSSVFRGYKTLVISITPQAGQNLTSIDLRTRHNQSNFSTTFLTQWLDMRIAANNLTTMRITGTDGVGSSQNFAGMLEQFEFINDGNLSGFDRAFSNCYNLRRIIKLPRTSTLGNFEETFRKCYSLEEIPWFDTSSATNFLGTFWECTSLRNIPALNTANATSMSTMFAVSGIRTIPWLNTSKVTNMSSMFSNCTDLLAVPFLDTSNVTDMSNMFRLCPSLTSVPQFNTSKVTTMSAMFFGSPSLKELPFFDTSNVTNMSSMFEQGANTNNPRSGPSYVPPLNTSKVTNMSNMFAYAADLITGPSFDTSNVTNMNGMFLFCTRLKEIPQYNTSRVTDISNWLYGCVSLRNIPALNLSSALVLSDMIRGCSKIEGLSGFTFHGGTGTWNTSAFLRTFYDLWNLRSLGTLNLSGVCSAAGYANVYSDVFFGNYNLQTLGITGIQHSFSIANAKLGATALNDVYNGLAVVGASGSATKTVTVTGNWGASAALGHNPAIAVAKGWAVTG